MADYVPSESDPGQELRAQDEVPAEAVLEGELVEPSTLLGVRALSASRTPAAPSVRAAAAAAGGFLAGAATFALLHRRDARRLARALGRPMLDPGASLFPSGGSRSYLLDVHVITKRER